jgi:hypothetical protein
MQIQPQAVSLANGEGQEFQVDTAAFWQLTPSTGRLTIRSANAVHYQAPHLIWISRNIQLHAARNGETADAQIELSSATSWIAVLSLLFPPAALALMASLFCIWPGRDRSMIALVLIMGALGATLGASRSFANFVGNRTFRASWALFYLLRPIFGAGLALLVFFGCRIGMVAALATTTSDSSGAAFVSGLTGLFADTVLGKLKEVVTPLFPPTEPRGDKMQSPAGPA